MSKILLIEPSKMMQQGIVLSLFPNHEVEVAEMLPDSGVAGLKAYDVVVLDAAALREKNILTAQAVRAIQSSAVPVIWLESKDGPGVASRNKLVILNRPIARTGLAAALAQCLEHRSGTRTHEKANGAEKETKRPPKEPTKVKGKTAAAPDKRETKIIELVDVVEEAPAEEKQELAKKK
jgi:DNA-binding response OmpR family regulator